MRKLQKKVIILFGSVALLLGSFCLAEGQYRSVRVYRPSRYNKTRVLMNRRAAARKVIKKVRRNAAKQRRQRLRRKQR